MSRILRLQQGDSHGWGSGTVNNHSGSPNAFRVLAFKVLGQLLILVRAFLD